MECQAAVRKAQAFAAFCNAENAMLISKRKFFAEPGRVASGVFTNPQANAARCWVNDVEGQRSLSASKQRLVLATFSATH